MNIVRIVLQVLLVLSSFFLIIWTITIVGLGLVAKLG